MLIAQDFKTRRKTILKCRARFQSAVQYTFWCLKKGCSRETFTLWKHIRAKPTIYIKKQTKSSILTTFLLKQVAAKVFLDFEEIIVKAKEMENAAKNIRKNFKKLRQSDYRYSLDRY